MNKREFLKKSGILITGAALSRFVSAENQSAARTNWAGNYKYSTDHLLQPKTVEEVQKAVKSCSKLKALGARHSFNGIADSTANQISLKQLQSDDVWTKRHARSPSAPELRMVNWRLISMPRALRYTTWPRCPMFLSPAPAQLRPTVPAARMAICRRRFPRWNLLRPMGRS